MEDLTRCSPIAIVAMMNRLIGGPARRRGVAESRFWHAVWEDQSEDDTPLKMREKSTRFSRPVQSFNNEAFRRLASYLPCPFIAERAFRTLARLILHNAASILSTADGERYYFQPSQQDGNHLSPLGPIHKPA
ncbi:MAG: hypothetical protein H6874_10400 [Hyphomicrobiaceae bacterium]|nr:hypothetical protein [Hyphomicrobiaceae bacterium]